MRTSGAADSRPAVEVITPELRDALLAQVADRCVALTCFFEIPSMRLVYWNGAAREALGNEEEEEDALGRIRLRELIEEASFHLFDSDIRNHLNVLGHWRGLCGFRTLAGRKLRLMASFDRLGAGEGSSGFIALQALGPIFSNMHSIPGATDRDLLVALLNHHPDHIYFKDRESRYLRVSSSLARHRGIEDSRRLMGKTDFDFFSLEDAAKTYEDERRIMETGEAVIDKVEKMEGRKDGSTFWFTATKLPLRDENNRIVGTFGISRDITARMEEEHCRRELELQLQLASKLESIGMLAAGVAHEINTPTQFITDNLEFLGDAFARCRQAIERYRAAFVREETIADSSVTAIEAGLDLDFFLEETPKALEQSGEGLGRVARIVRSLREFSHPHNAESAPQDLHRAIETTIAVARHEWKYVAEVRCEFDPEMPLVPCVLDQINQVVLNLVVNAAHAISERQTAESSEKLGTIVVRTRRAGHWAEIEVEDNGSGIPDAVRPHIFELFFTTKEAGKGTGQGLAMVRNIVVKQHLGTIGFETKWGKGTLFRVRLPLGGDTVAEAQPMANP